jgi:hypothetical protein
MRSVLVEKALCAIATGGHSWSCPTYSTALCCVAVRRCSYRNSLISKCVTCCKSQAKVYCAICLAGAVLSPESSQNCGAEPVIKNSCSIEPFKSHKCSFIMICNKLLVIVCWDYHLATHNASYCECENHVGSSIKRHKPYSRSQSKRRETVCTI